MTHQETITQGRHTAALLSALAQAPATTAQLSTITGFKGRLIWVLLKSPKDKNLVAYNADTGFWRLTQEYKGPAIIRAVALLESKGWICIPPEKAEA
jgi:hypothetical protein